jgi:hypothetical protein
MVDAGLASGLKKDSLFLGFKLGMTKKAFYARAWKLNNEQKVTNGGRNMSVEYTLKELKYPAKMNFYPTFYHNRIYQMPVVVHYTEWSPWNKKLFADSLLTDLVHLFKKKYSKDFIVINNKEKGKVYVNVEGNRAISIFKNDDNELVNILFTDLSIQREILKQKQPWTYYWNRVQNFF